MRDVSGWKSVRLELEDEDDIIADVSDFFLFLVFPKSFITFVLSVQMTSNKFLKICKIKICLLELSNTLFQRFQNSKFSNNVKRFI